MESMWSYCTQNDAPWHPYQTTPVTMGEFIMALNQIEVEHQKNAKFLKNPNSVIQLDEFCKQVMAAQKVAEDVGIQENRGIPPPHNDLAHGQEVIFYAISHLCAVVTAWINVVQNGPYKGCHPWWMTGLAYEMVSASAITTYLPTNTSLVWSICYNWGVHCMYLSVAVPPTHPLILETSHMIEQWVGCCNRNWIPSAEEFQKVDYIAGIETYFEVGTNDPTHIVDAYFNAWWLLDAEELDFPSYAFNPYEYLVVHQPQVSTMLVCYLQWSIWL